MNGNTQRFKQERVAFFNGQRLTAGDLNAAQDVNRTMRWLHNSSLHNWGIGFGLAVTGEKGARVMTIAPGYALDALGREIVLAEPQTLAVPPLAGVNGEPAERDLTIAYRTEDEDVETREGVCLPRRAVRLSTAPVIGWLETTQVRNGFDIVLARASIRNCQLEAPLSTTQRRNARPPQQPYIAAGQTSKGKTSWNLWPAPSNPEGAWGVETYVDTSTARFRITPRYVARVAGKRLLANDEFQGRVAAQFASTVLGASTAATIHDGSPYADQLQQVFAETFQELGGTITFQGTINVGDTDMRPILTTIAADSPNVLYFPISEPEASLIASQSAGVSGLENTTLMGRESVVLLVEGFVSVVDATPSSFTLRVLPPRGLIFGNANVSPPERLSVGWLNPEAIFVDNGAKSVFKTQLNWHVVWMGVEG